MLYGKIPNQKFSIGEVRPHPHLSQILIKRELRGRVRMMSKNGKVAGYRMKRRKDEVMKQTG